MSLRLETLQVARLAPKLLGGATGSVATYLQEQFNEDGGARDRDGVSDLYYTVFTLDSLSALQAATPEHTVQFLRSFGDGGELDLVHLACLARCWSGMPHDEPSPSLANSIADNLERFRSLDGGYNNKPGNQHGTVYHAFLAFGAHQDLGRTCPDTDALTSSLESLRSKDGAFANTPGLPLGVTTVTAAAVTLLRHLDHSVDASLGQWLLARLHGGGGFLAAPQAPMPDLLSTATALHALSGMQVDFAPLKEPCLDFIDTLWTGRAFCGSWGDDVTDSEYTFYGLLALGHLSL